MKDMPVKLLDVAADIEAHCTLAHKSTSGHTIVEAAYRGNYPGLYVFNPWGRHMVDERTNK